MSSSVISTSLPLPRQLPLYHGFLNDVALIIRVCVYRL
jgi:hypothetical protein